MTEKHEPWFVMLHVMDVHQGANMRRLFNFIYKLHYLPKLYRIRKRFKSDRNIWYELSLMYVDGQTKRIIKKLTKENYINNTVIMVSGDHGRGWDSGRDLKFQKELGFRTYYENINAAFICSNVTGEPSNIGLHDGMSITATLLDELNIPQDEKFKGVSIYEEGKYAVITEGYERRNCDLDRRDLAFTVTSEKYKLMVKLVGNTLNPVRFYDLQEDPKEYINKVSSKEYLDDIYQLMNYLVSERKELLIKRKVELSNYNNAKLIKHG